MSVLAPVSCTCYIQFQRHWQAIAMHCLERYVDPVILLNMDLSNMEVQHDKMAAVM